MLKKFQICLLCLAVVPVFNSDLSWNLDKVTSTAEMFQNCSDLSSNLHFDFNSNIDIDMSGMFVGCSSFEASGNDLDKWDVSGVTNMESMFKDCYELTGGDLKNWYVQM